MDIQYVDRRGTDCNKWDGQQNMFGEEGLHAMWVADMDFKVADCVICHWHRRFWQVCLTRRRVMSNQENS